jgi:hypothetical protein
MGMVDETTRVVAASVVDSLSYGAARETAAADGAAATTCAAIEGSCTDADAVTADGDDAEAGCRRPACCRFAGQRVSTNIGTTYAR